MNIPANPHFRHWTVFVAIVSLSILIGCDETRTSIGGSGDETSTVAFYRPDGKPAAGARVMIYGSADTGISPRDQVIADSRGSVDLPVLDKGFYNLVVREDGTAIFQDSLFSNGERILAASDTLRATGVLVGRLRVQPQHSPRIAWVHLLGAGKYLNVDDSGFFRMEGVPQGRFTMAALTRVSHYTPTFMEVRAVSDSVVDVGNIELVYTGLPVVKNLQAQFDTLAGLVHLRWDSLSLRETWRYNVYRDDLLVGQTTGHRWIDTVSDEYPGNVPGQGVHTYQVRMASADSVGSKWESITMRIISAYLYQEIKMDWQKMSALPWRRGYYRIDTAGTQLVAWRADDTKVKRIEMWASNDSGRSWDHRADSLPLSALPVWFDNSWWSVTREDGELSDSCKVVSSLDGVVWDTIGSIRAAKPGTSWRLAVEAKTVIVFEGCENTPSCSDGLNPYYADIQSWKWIDPLFVETTEQDMIGAMGAGVGIWKRFWSDGWQSFSSLGGRLTIGTEIAGGSIQLPKFITSYSYQALQMGHFLFRMHGRYLGFSEASAFSIDSALTVSHALAWPGSGFHFEMRYGGGILSASDSGIYLGKVLPGPPSDPRGTWVKKTEIPVQY